MFVNDNKYIKLNKLAKLGPHGDSIAMAILIVKNLSMAVPLQRDAIGSEIHNPPLPPI